MKYENDTEYYRALCLLFFPFRNEFKDIHSKDVEELYKQNENLIEEVRVHFEKHRDFLEKMKEIEDNKKNENQDANDEDEDDVQSDDETTTAEEMKDFQKFAQRQAQNQVRKYN